MDFENNYKKFLKDTSNCTEEESLSRKEMLELEAAINNSKDTASMEEEKREYIRQAEEMQANSEKASALKQRRESMSPVDIFDNESAEQPSQKEFDITFQDMPESLQKSLKIIYHDPVYALPIPFNPKYQKCSIAQRTKLLCDYHSKLGQLKTKLAKRSQRRAPFSKPITLSCNRNASSKNRPNEDANAEESEEIPTQDFYVSRAGRQIKRKIYTEDPDLDDFEFSSLKKNKFTDSDTKITLDTPFVPEENHNEEKSKPVKTRKDTPTKRALLSLTTKKKGRLESFYDKMREDEAKKKQKQEEMEQFEKTLPTVEEFEDEDKFFMEEVQEAPVEENEENFVRKRVVPPIPGRRPGIRAKKPSVEDFDKIDVIAASPPSSPKILKQYGNLNKSVTITKSAPKATRSKENQSKAEITISKIDKPSCPICNRQFLQSEIEDHAANCGIEEEVLEESVRASDKLRCELCEKEFTANTSYEVHVKQCIAKVTSDL